MAIWLNQSIPLTDPKVPVRQGSPASRHATTHRRCNATRNPHLIIGTHHNAHTTNPKVDANEGWVCVFRHKGKAGEDKSGNATFANKSEETKELNGVLKDGQGDTFPARSILKKIGWPSTTRKDTSVQEEETDLHWVLFCGDERMDRRTHRSNEDVHQQWTQLCEKESRIAAWKLHKHVFKIRGKYVPRKQGYVLQHKHCDRSYLPNRNQPQIQRVSSRLKRIYAYDEQ